MYSLDAGQARKKMRKLASSTAAESDNAAVSKPYGTPSALTELAQKRLCGLNSAVHKSS